MESLETESLRVNAQLNSSTNSKCSATKGGARPGWTWIQLLHVGLSWRSFKGWKATPRWPLFFLTGKLKLRFVANWKSTPTLSHHINAHNIKAYKHYGFKMNSLLRKIVWLSLHSTLKYAGCATNWQPLETACALSKGTVVMWMQWKWGGGWMSSISPLRSQTQGHMDSVEVTWDSGSYENL